jgi:uncharacterized RDD family membrane protein YckC
MAEKGTDEEAARASQLLKRGGYRLALVGLSVEQFEAVCQAVTAAGLEFAVDRDGQLVVGDGTPEQIDALRRRLRHGRRDLDQAVLVRLRDRRGSRAIAVDHLTPSERNRLVSGLAGRNVLAAVDDLDVVLARGGMAAAGELLAELGDEAGVEPGDDPTAEGTARAPAPDDLAYAPHLKRVLGFSVDATLFILVAFATGLVANVLGFEPSVGFILGLTLWLPTDMLMHSRTGQTLGKRVADTKVVDAATGGPIASNQAILRTTIHLAPLLLGNLGVLVFVAVHVPAGFTPKRQGLHDMAAKTVVVELGSRAG